MIPGLEGPGSWGGDDRLAYLIGRLDGGLSSDDLGAVGFDGRGSWTVPILELTYLDSCLWRTSSRTCLIEWVAVFYPDETSRPEVLMNTWSVGSFVSWG